MMRLDKHGLVHDLISVFESYPPMQKFLNKELDVIEVQPDQIEKFIVDFGKIFNKLLEENTYIDDDSAPECEHNHEEGNDE